MSEITVETLERRIKQDSRQWGTPFEQRSKTLAHVLTNPHLVICDKCEGEQGYLNIFSLYVGCPICGGRGVLRKHWWKLWVTLPPSFYEEPLP